MVPITVTENSQKIKLIDLTERLYNRGVRDVKFATSKTVKFNVDDAITVLEAMLDGNTSPFTGVGDKHHHE